MTSINKGQSNGAREQLVLVTDFGVGTNQGLEQSEAWLLNRADQTTAEQESEAANTVQFVRMSQTRFWIVSLANVDQVKGG